MGFFKKIFGKGENEPDDKHDKNPDNTKLIHLLNSYSKSPSQGNYKQVVLELMNGNAYLLLPSINKTNNKNSGWQVSDEDTSLKLTSVYDQDGLKVLGAFTDKDSLFNWAKKSTEYTSLGTKAITDICQQLGIGRIIINSGQETMFVLERNRENLKEMKIRKGTEIAIGTPANPLDRRILGKLVTNFQKVN